MTSESPTQSGPDRIAAAVRQAARHAGMLADHRIVVLQPDPLDAQRLRSLIEFMDAPPVVVATPECWVGALGEYRLAALFLSTDLGTTAISTVCRQLGDIDRNAPIVLYGERPPPLDEFAWARVLTLRNPPQIDEMHTVLEEIWALHSLHRLDDAGVGRGTRLIGDSAEMQMIRALIERVAPSQATVLIAGESGTGKELIARRIHELSGAGGEFVAINCGAIPDNLLESELFGHEKGAFTGAHAARAGRFEQAEGGTLFLDEIGDMPAPMQVKLLRVLQERVVERVGSTRGIPVDIRVVAATHRNLPERIAAGRFREDLYYRLNVFPIDIKPLRERREDVAPLTRALIDRVATNYGVRVTLADDALAALTEYDWPGNVRELANVVERLAVIHEHREVRVDDLPLALRPFVPTVLSDTLEPAANPAALLPPDGLDLREHLATLERGMIAAALRDADGVVQKAAERLGMGRTTLVEKIRRHELRD